MILPHYKPITYFSFSFLPFEPWRNCICFITWELNLENEWKKSYFFLMHCSFKVSTLSSQVNLDILWSCKFYMFQACNEEKIKMLKQEKQSSFLTVFSWVEWVVLFIKKKRKKKKKESAMSRGKEKKDIERIDSSINEFSCYDKTPTMRRVDSFVMFTCVIFFL